MKKILIIIGSFFMLGAINAQKTSNSLSSNHESIATLKSLTNDEKDVLIKSRKNTFYGSFGYFQEGVGTLRANYKRKVTNFLSMKSSVGVVAGYGAAFLYDVGPMLEVGYKNFHINTGALLYGAVSYENQAHLAIPFGIEFKGKENFYLNSQAIYIPEWQSAELQFGIGTYF